MTSSKLVGLDDTFARMVRKKQDELGLTQGQFAELLGVDGSTLSYFYGGRRSPKVAAAVGLAFGEFKDAALLFMLEGWPRRFAQGND